MQTRAEVRPLITAPWPCSSRSLSGAPPRDRRPPARYARATGLKPEKAARYREPRAAPWPGVVAMIRACHIRNFSIHERDIDGKTYLFAYLEYTGDDFAADMKRMAAEPEIRRRWAQTDPCRSPLPDAAARGAIRADTRELMSLP